MAEKVTIIEVRVSNDAKVIILAYKRDHSEIFAKTLYDGYFVIYYPSKKVEQKLISSGRLITSAMLVESNEGVFEAYCQFQNIDPNWEDESEYGKYSNGILTFEIVDSIISKHKEFEYLQNENGKFGGNGKSSKVVISEIVKNGDELFVILEYQSNFTTGGGPYTYTISPGQNRTSSGAQVNWDYYGDLTVFYLDRDFKLDWSKTVPKRQAKVDMVQSDVMKYFVGKMNGELLFLFNQAPNKKNGKNGKYFRDTGQHRPKGQIVQTTLDHKGNMKSDVMINTTEKNNWFIPNTSFLNNNKEIIFCVRNGVWGRQFMRVN